MIERGFTKLGEYDGVIHGWKARAHLPCGCSAYVGIRFDNHEAVLDAVPCKPEHVPMLRRFLDRYQESLADPSDRPAVEVADELLTEAAEGA